MYLLDTHVVLELRKAKSGQTDSGLIRWAASVPRQNLFISALTLLELETSLAQQANKDKVAAQALRSWLNDQVMKAFDGHILAIDTQVVMKRSHVQIKDPRDALLAATAMVHGLSLVTRNVTDFKAARLKVFNPWEYAPAPTDDNADWRQAANAGPQWLKNLFLRF